MSIESIRSKIHEMADKINDESALHILMEDAEIYTNTDTTIEDNLTPARWVTIEEARIQIKIGEFKTYSEVKEHFTQRLSK